MSLGEGGLPTIKIAGVLRAGRADYHGPVRLEAVQPGAVVVFGTGATTSAPALLFLAQSFTTLAGGLNVRVDGPARLGYTIYPGPAYFQLQGGTFVVSPPGRLRVEAAPFDVRGNGLFRVEGELSVAVRGGLLAPDVGAAVTVPTQISGTLTIDLDADDEGAASRVSFAGLTAGGALAFGYPGGAAAPFPAGATFTPFTYTSLTGAFDPVTFPTLAGGRDWTFALEPTRARLSVVLGQGPIPADDEVTTDEEVPISFDPAANDFAPFGGALTTVAIGPSTLGQVVLGADGRVTFTPSPNVSGQQTLLYTVRGADGREATGQVHLVVRPVNDAPVAVDDQAETQEAVLVSIDVLANDTDVDGPPRAIASVEDPAIGNTFRSEGRVLYSPPVGFVGTVTFGYVVTDGALTDQGQVSVTVRPFIPSEPVPAAVSVSAPAPNPSSGLVAVRVSLPASARVSADVFDALGRRVRSAAPQTLAAGVHAVALGAGLPPGAYVYRVHVEGDAAPVEAAGRFVVAR